MGKANRTQKNWDGLKMKMIYFAGSMPPKQKYEKEEEKNNISQMKTNINK